MPARISAAIQHTPGRDERLPALLDALAPLSPVVVTDPEPLARRSPWRTYRACLEAAPADASHHLVVQDDLIVCEGFSEALSAVVAACECRMVCLCVCHEPAESARRILEAEAAGERWALMDTGRWLPALANVWPTAWIKPALEWVDLQRFRPNFTADDEIIGRIVRENGWSASATIPSLAHHDDEVESFAGQKAMYGANLGRVTLRWRPDLDARQLRW